MGRCRSSRVGTGALLTLTLVAPSIDPAQQFVNVRFHCPSDTWSVGIDWRNTVPGSYQEAGKGPKPLDFKVDGGIDRIEANFHSMRREGYTQKIVCKYATPFGGVHYAYKVNREIISCEVPPQGVRDVLCKLKP